MNETIKMDPERFKELLEELDGNSVKTLAEKNARYSTDGDSLHNFRSGAEVAGGTPAQACWGYMTKHLVALRDMVERNDFSNREDFLEKCQDTINYIRFLWCIGNEQPCVKEKETFNQQIIKVFRRFDDSVARIYPSTMFPELEEVDMGFRIHHNKVFELQSPIFYPYSSYYAEITRFDERGNATVELINNEKESK